MLACVMAGLAADNRLFDRLGMAKILKRG